jgi:hypothetical protein
MGLVEAGIVVRPAQPGPVGQSRLARVENLLGQEAAGRCHHQRAEQVARLDR